MHRLRTPFALTILAGFLAASIPGCGGNSGLEKPQVSNKPADPINDMPGYKEQMQKEGRTK